LSDHVKPPIIEKTGTDVLMRAMQDFSDSEPLWVMVLYMNEKQELCWMRSDSCATTTIGALDLTREAIVRDWLQPEDPA
jgi:hypothetical protein